MGRGLAQVISGLVAHQAPLGDHVEIWILTYRRRGPILVLRVAEGNGGTLLQKRKKVQHAKGGTETANAATEGTQFLLATQTTQEAPNGSGGSSSGSGVSGKRESGGIDVVDFPSLMICFQLCSKRKT